MSRLMSMLVTFSFKIKITQCYHYFKQNSYEQTYHSGRIDMYVIFKEEKKLGTDKLVCS